MLNNHFNLTFLSNKYSKCYYNIVSKALQADREKLPKNNKNFVYYESHHIIPKSIKPEFKDLSVNAWNKVLLTPKEHFICHLLLTKMLTGPDKNKMVYALWGMTNQSNKHQSRFHSNLYTTYKLKMQASLSSDRKNKSFIDLYGEERAAEIKANMLTRKPRGPNSPEETLAASTRMKERHQTNPWKRFMQTNGQLPKIECPHCLKIVDPGNYARHHGENCKRITTSCPVCNTSFSSVPWENKKYCCRECSKQARYKGASVDLI